MTFGGLHVAQLAPAPGAAEVEAVEMSDLAVAPVADGRGLKQGRRLARRDPRQELLEPDWEQRRVGALHAQGLDQRGRQEFVAARLPGLAVAVGAEPLARTLADLLSE